MQYESVALPDAMSVDGIYSVLRVEFSKAGVGIGEAHDFPEISFVSRGKHYGMIDGVTGERVAGQLVIIAPGSFHKATRPSDSELLIISFASGSSALQSLYNRTLNLSPSQEKNLRSIVEDGLGIFCRRAPGSDVQGMILKNDADESLLYKMKKELELFLVDLYRCFVSENKNESAAVKRYDLEFNRVVAFLSEHIDEALTVAEIAAATMIGVSKLKFLFREKSGGGVVNYFIEMKIERAKELIIMTDMTFTEIAESLGFNSIHYFSRLFKKLTGASPSEYRELHIDKHNAASK